MVNGGGPFTVEVRPIFTLKKCCCNYNHKQPLGRGGEVRGIKTNNQELDSAQYSAQKRYRLTLLSPLPFCCWCKPINLHFKLMLALTFFPGWWYSCCCYYCRLLYCSTFNRRAIVFENAIETAVPPMRLFPAERKQTNWTNVAHPV